MVTAETAMVLPVLVLFLFAAVAAVAVVQARVRCADAARESVRAAARGGAGPHTGSIDITLSRQGETETATARLGFRPLAWLPAVTVSESAVAAVEPASGSSP